MSDRITASPEKELDQLRKSQQDDREKVRAIEARMERRAKEIEETRRDAQMIDRLRRHDVKDPLTVLIEADEASARADVPMREFRAMALCVLKKETGLPQRAIFGCDHGAQGGRPPYCHEQVTPDRGKAFLRALHADRWANMNGVHWTQTTWYEKVFRVERRSPDLTDPAAHLHVCLGDLALLRAAYGARDAFRRYNGSGPAAEEYARVCMGWLPQMTEWVTVTR